ncbi:ABC transporter substrate-binding protein [Psychromicrobium xiongbiense]|uniref:ABC transporter substrate-binding protein n=1 Tax=Psychromicrobium xiongbiense TaxID=3051184 RepID=UPI002556EAB2|nr:ABC transporter substrate-binding protein [Psychromicrobium sp. YIM S02556]
MSTHTLKLRSLAVVAGASLLALTACTGPAGNSGSGGSGSGSGGSLTIGTTDKVTALDPAGSYDNGSLFMETQVYPFLLNVKPQGNEIEPDLAASASFTSPTEYTVKLRPNLKFANGHTLDSTDVKFSFDRIVKINDENGPASLLENLSSVAAPDPNTVVFTLKQPNDQTFPGVLTSSAGPIVDHAVFPADKLMTDEDIAKAHPFAGAYDVTSYTKNQLVSLKANPNYVGLVDKAKTDVVNVQYYANANNLKLDIQTNKIDVAWRSLSATDIGDLKTKSNVKVQTGPGGELRYLVFNFNTMPFGAKTPEASPQKSLAVRQAVADLIDRQAISTDVYKGTYTPVYSPVASGLPGAKEPLKSLYGDGSGGPSLDKAKKVLADAGVTGPVTLNLQYNPDHYGPGSGDEYAKIKDQLDKSGLFKVNLQSTEWTQYSKDRTADLYPVYQLGWFPDYTDADNYLSPFFSKDNFLHNHYDNAQVQTLIQQQRVETDKAKRADLIGQIQDLEAKDLSTLPMLQGNQVAVSGTNVSGVDTTLDAAFKFRAAVISKK